MATSCTVSVKPRDPTVDENVHSQSDVAATTQQIRLRMRSLVDPMSGEIESAADRIIAGTESPEIKRAAVEWKAEAVPAIRESLFQPDPLTALFDTWVLSNQMAVYFSTGPGAAALGDQSPVAVATSLNLERQMRDVAASISRSGSVSTARAAAREWAAAHPITTRISHRESTLARVFERELGPDLTATETLGNMNMTVDDLNRRLEIYADQLFRQIRWEAQIISMDLADQFQLDSAMPLANRTVDSVEQVVSSVDTALPMLERLVMVAEDAPLLFASERTEAIAAVQEELTRTIQFIRGEREAALQHVTSERLAALQFLHDVITDERKTLTQDVETIGIAAIDHAFWRATQLVAAVLTVLLIATLLGLFLVRRLIVGLLRERAQAPAG